VLVRFQVITIFWFNDLLHFLHFLCKPILGQDKERGGAEGAKGPSAGGGGLAVDFCLWRIFARRERGGAEGQRGLRPGDFFSQRASLRAKILCEKKAKKRHASGVSFILNISGSAKQVTRETCFAGDNKLASYEPIGLLWKL